MKKNNFVKVLETAFLFLYLVTGFSSCASTKAIAVEKLDYYKSPYYDQFAEKFNNNADDKSIEDIFVKWEAENPDGDFYKSCFTYYFNQAITQSDNSNVNFPADLAYIHDPNDKNILIYIDCNVDKNKLDKAINYLYKGIERYPNRIDLWDVLMSINNQFHFYYDLKNVILDFIEVQNIIDISLDIWYADFNTKVIITEFEQPDSIVRDRILTHSSSIVDYFPDKESMNYYKEIFTRLEQLYPEDSKVLSELGYSFMLTNDIKGAIPYLERAIKTNNQNYSAITNLIICLYATNQNEKAEKYVKMAYDIGDEKLIQNIENNLKVLGVLKN